MMRGLVLLTLMIACSGCMMIEDMLFVEDTQPGYPVQQTVAQGAKCGTPLVNVVASQTAEPELLHVRR